MKSSKYYVNDITLHVMEAGMTGNPVILFLHGFPEFWYGWIHQIEFFKEKGYHVVVPDLRGYNLSDKPPHTRDYLLNTITKDIAELILLLQQKKVFLAGHDWGGIVAWNLAEKYPRLVEKMINLNAPHPLAMQKVVRRNITQLFHSWYAFFFQLPFLPEWLLHYNHFRILSTLMHPGNGKGLRNKSELKEYHKAWEKPSAIHSMLQWYRAGMADYVYVREIECPVLILWGKKDVTLVPEIAEENAKLCHYAEVKYFDNCTHWIHHESPERVNKEIEAFISATPSTHSLA